MLTEWAARSTLQGRGSGRSSDGREFSKELGVLEVLSCGECHQRFSGDVGLRLNELEMDLVEICLSISNILEIFRRIACDTQFTGVPVA